VPVASVSTLVGDPIAIIALSQVRVFESAESFEYQTTSIRTERSPIPRHSDKHGRALKQAQIVVEWCQRKQTVVMQS
jgi:hypothetical protein